MCDFTEIIEYVHIFSQELKYFGVSVHILEPGIFKTPMAAKCNVKVSLGHNSEKMDVKMRRKATRWKLE